jgi:prepilin-type N-terminal cleavage/methylation domain-containing protein
MHLRSLRKIRDEQSGVTLIEVLISSMVLLIVSAGLFTALTAGNRATATERHRAKANDLAEQELERVRSLRIGDLSSWNSTRRVMENGTELATGAACPPGGQTCYTVTSSTQFLTEPASTSTCASGTGSRDYLQLKVSVSWTGMSATAKPVTAGTVISPPNGSLVPNAGSLLVQIDDADSTGISGVSLTGSGAGSFSGTTGTTGCVLWRNLPAGTYTMTAGGAATGMVDPDGVAPTGETVSVVDQATNTVNLQYDRPGSIPVSFTTRRQSDNAIVSTLPTVPNTSVKADSLIAFNTGMTAGPKRFGTPGTMVSSITASGLFPFSSPVSVYAGLCQSTTVGGAAVASINVPAGGSQAATVQLPALHLNVYQGLTTTSPKAVGATVTAEDLLCPNLPTTGFKRTFTTNASGQLDNPGLPMSDYRICATANVPGIGNRKIRTNDTLAPSNVSLDDPADLNSPSTTLNLFLQGPGSSAGSTCP